MVSQELVHYLFAQLKAGKQLYEIRSTLLTHGWESGDIEAGLQAVHQQLLRMVSASQPQKKLAKPHWSRAILLSLVIFGSGLLFIGFIVFTSLFRLNSQPITSFDTYAEAPSTFESTERAHTTAGSVLDFPKSMDIATTSAGVADVSTASGNVQAKRESYSIALFGDSMIDSLGGNLESVSNTLERTYSNSTFTMYNYGIGAENVEMGLSRFHQPYTYKDRTYPPISTLKPDFIIIGSYAYNPFSPHDRNKHWTTLATLLQEAQKTGSKVYLLAEIAPLREKFGTGSVDWSTEYRIEHATKIRDQLENAVGLASALQIPLINVFEPSQDSGGFGSGEYTNASDGIHPSASGVQFTARIIVETLQLE